MRRAPLLAALAGVLLADTAVAAPRVEALQMPAWIERGGQTAPVAAGETLRSGDALRAGPAGRIVVADPGVGVLLIGADTSVRLWLPDREPLPGVDKRFGLLMDVRRGAVRFSAKAPPAGAPGGLLVQTEGLSASLASGDAALRSAPPAACLISGQLLVQHDTRLLTLDEGGACVGEGGAWIGAIDLAPGGGTVGGSAERWTVNVASPRSKAEADELTAALRRDGYPAEVLPVLVKERQHYRVRFVGLAGQAEARALAERVPERYTRGKPWIAPE
jgi:hypothetical protein